MTRLSWTGLAALIALAGCASQTRMPPVVAGGRPAVCRVGPDGGQPVADRGIGGTGSPGAQASLQASVQVADRGIGGTGIIGVITGFASLCVAGEEVALPADVPVRIDDRPAGAEALRAGQVAALTAGGTYGALRARAVDIIHIVTGPVESVANGSMVVAGQRVDLAGAAGAAIGAKPGDWVAVSGFKTPGGTPGGTIAATRIDAVAPGRVLVRGELLRVYGTARIGTLAVQLPDQASLPGGWSVAVTGRLESGVLVADTAKLDVADESPSAYFGPGIGSYLIEAYVTAAPGGFFVNHDFVAVSGAGAIASRGRRIVSFERGAGGTLSAVGQRDSNGGGGENRDFLPAPLPGGSLPLNSPGVSDDDPRVRVRSSPATGQPGGFNGRGPPHP